jgi:2-phosphosulfolactate phosphatase
VINNPRPELPTRPELVEGQNSAAARMIGRAEAGAATGAVVVIDVLRAFSTAAYAFGSGAKLIMLVESPDEALMIKKNEPDVLLAGEDGGRRIAGFDFPNSPAAMAAADLSGRRLVLRTSAGTRGAVAARNADRLWCAGLATASATAAAVTASGLGEPTYVITGSSPANPQRGDDDRETARYIESVRIGTPLDREQVRRRIADGPEAQLTLALGDDHVHPDDITLAARADVFDFAMQASQVGRSLVLQAVPLPA